MEFKKSKKHRSRKKRKQEALAADLEKQKDSDRVCSNDGRRRPANRRKGDRRLWSIAQCMKKSTNGIKVVFGPKPWSKMQ